MLYKELEFDEPSYELPFSEFRVFGEYEAESLLLNEPDKWNVISIWSEYFVPSKYGSKLWVPGTTVKQPPNMYGALSLEQHYFHDSSYKSDEVTLCDVEHIKSILAYARRHRGEPLLIHCHAGISRSTAIAFLVMLDNIKDISECPVEDALAIVYRIRPQMFPLKHIINIGVPLIAPDVDTEIEWFRELYNCGIARKISGGL